MWNNKEAHFEGDYFFKDAAVGTGTAAQVSGVFTLGQTEGGIRVRGWAEGAIACASGDTVTTVLEVGDDKDSTAGTDWEGISTQTVTASSTSLSGEFFSYIPDTEKKFMRVSVANGTGMTGKFSVAVEYIPR